MRRYRPIDRNKMIEYRAMTEDGAPSSTIVSATVDDFFTQLLLHKVHHRAQAMKR